MAASCAKDAKKCPDTPFTRPRELPERITWVEVDPKTNGWIEIARVQGSQNRVAESSGQYSFWDEGHVPPGVQEWYPASGGTFLIHNSNTGADQVLRADHIYAISDFSVVSYRIWDSYYGDNRTKNGDKLRAAVYTPVYSIQNVSARHIAKKSTP